MRIILADDHTLVRDGLVPFLHQLDKDVSVTEASSLAEVMAEKDKEPHPNIILLDLFMPGMDGPRSVATVREAFPKAAVVIISGQADRATILSAINFGARGFIPKTTRGNSLINALRLVLGDEIYLPPTLIEGGEQDATAGSGPPKHQSVLDKLSTRETEILRLLIRGQTNKEIARDLNLQEISIKVHLRNVYRKLGAVNRADAVRIAMQNGWT